MNKKLLILFFVSFISAKVFAQLEVKANSFKEVPGFVNIDPDKQTDDNEKPYSVIKVRTENINDKQRRELNFKGDAQTFFEIEYRDGEVWLYISYYATFLKISHPDLSSTEFPIPFDMKPKCGYELTLVNKASIDNDIVKRLEILEQSNKNSYNNQIKEQVGYITVKSEPKGAHVMIDNVEVGVTPYLSERISIGNHKISVNLKGYEPIAKRVNIELNKESEVVFKLDEENNHIINTNHNTSFANKTFTVNGVSFEMVAVKGGSFIMGCTWDDCDDCFNEFENPSHSVTLSDYYIGKFEVTQKLWNAVMGGNNTNDEYGNIPVNWLIHWDDCIEFIDKLNQITGMKFRLPTEAEWEYAARGGNKSKGYKYSGSDNIESVAWYTNNSEDFIYQVGEKKSNELGICDMSGNVEEWCNDYYEDYSPNNQTNPKGPISGKYHVLRGGSWNSRARHCCVSARSSNIFISGGTIGLRLALSK